MLRVEMPVRSVDAAHEQFPSSQGCTRYNRAGWEWSQKWKLLGTLRNCLRKGRGGRSNLGPLPNRRPATVLPGADGPRNLENGRTRIAFRGEPECSSYTWQARRASVEVLDADCRSKSRKRFASPDAEALAHPRSLQIVTTWRGEMGQSVCFQEACRVIQRLSCRTRAGAE